jgi:hypothetical protein
MASQESESSPGPVGSKWSRRHGGSGLGIVLVLLGAAFLLQQLTGFDVWRWSWPLIVVAAGAILFVGMFLGGKSAGGLAIPASITTMTGLILLVQNTFNAWETWAYAWALIVPTAAGVGTWLMGWWTDQPGARQTGRRMAEMGVVLFLGLAAFFELALNLSGFIRSGLGGTAIAVILILAGLYLLARRGELTGSRT